MIIRERPGFLRLFFILRGSIVPQIASQLALVFLVSCIVVAAYRVSPEWIGIDSAPFAMLGIALSVFLGFRNNACYDRWWEARRHWGTLIVAFRDLARQTLFLDLDPAARESRSGLLQLGVAYIRALLRALRPSASAGLAGRAESALDKDPPDRILQRMGAILADLAATGRISDIHFTRLDGTLSVIAGAQAAVERILNTPVPFAYTLLLHRTAYLFCFLLPFGLAEKSGWATPVLVTIAAYAFFGLDALSDELEQPFDRRPNGLPIEAMALAIETGLREALGEGDLPPAPLPRDFVLM